MRSTGSATTAARGPARQRCSGSFASWPGWRSGSEPTGLSSSSGSDRDRPRALAGVDPAFVEHLIARHGAPRKAPPLSFSEKERRELIARRERAIAAADPDPIA